MLFFAALAGGTKTFRFVEVFLPLLLPLLFLYFIFRPVYRTPPQTSKAFLARHSLSIVSDLSAF
jgi:hypothetical protein